jgi:hypothetical protein
MRDGTLLHNDTDVPVVASPDFSGSDHSLHSFSLNENLHILERKNQNGAQTLNT